MSSKSGFKILEKVENNEQIYVVIWPGVPLHAYNHFRIEHGFHDWRAENYNNSNIDKVIVIRVKNEDGRILTDSYILEDYTR